MSRYFLGAIVGIAAWTWIALVFYVNYQVSPWEVRDVQFAITMLGILMPAFAVFGAVLIGTALEKP